MRLIIQDRNSVIFNGINISDEIKSQVTGINFITQNMKFTRNATYLERLKARWFGNHSTNNEVFKTIVLDGWKKFSIYIDGVKKQEFYKGLLSIECEEVFINEVDEIFVETAISAEDFEKNSKVKW